MKFFILLNKHLLISEVHVFINGKQGYLGTENRSYLVYQLQTLRKKQAENKMEQTDRQTGRRKERCLVVP